MTLRFTWPFYPPHFSEAGPRTLNDRTSLASPCLARFFLTNRRRIGMKRNSKEPSLKRLASDFMKAGTKEHASVLSKQRMRNTYVELEKFAIANRWGDKVNPSNLTEKQFRKFANARLEVVGIRSVHNDTSAIRRALKAVGREDFAKSCSNADMGLPTADREGKGTAVHQEVLDRALEAAAESTSAWIHGMRNIGLRQMEVVRCAESLPVWERQLAKNLPLSVRFGTKGGRPREVCIRPENREKVLQAVKALQVVAESQGGKIVPSKSLQAACHLVGERLATLGLKGEDSGHSLRRAFAVDQFRFYREQGYSEKAAKSLVSTDLGHGDQRGTWAYNNYIRPTERAGR
jgi:hypothetical protein